MRGMLVDQSLRWLTEQQFGDDQQPNVLLAIERLLENMAAVAVRSQFYDATTRVDESKKVSRYVGGLTACIQRSYVAPRR